MCIRDSPEDTHLKLDLEHRDPDDGMTDIAYNKGAFFLRTLEEAVSREKFDAFLKQYFDAHAFETIGTEQFAAYLTTELLEPNSVEFNLEEWIYRPGMPDNCVKVHSPRLQKMTYIAEKVNNGENVFKKDLRGKEREDFTTQEWLAFIRGLSDEVDPKLLSEIDRHLAFSTEANGGIKSEWFQLAVRNGYKSVRPHMKAHLKRIGRRWFIEGIYQSLMNSDESDQAWANATYAEAKNNYHFVSRTTIEDILKGE